MDLIQLNEVAADETNDGHLARYAGRGTRRTQELSISSSGMFLFALFICGVASGQAVRKAERTPGDTRDLRAAFSLGGSLPYEGLGTVDILDDGMLAIQLGGTAWIDEEPVSVGTSDTFLFVLNDSGVSVVQYNGEYFVDVNGNELAKRGLYAHNVVRSLLPARTQIDPSAARFSVCSQTGTLRVDVTPGGTLTVVVEDEGTGARLFSFDGALILDAASAEVASAEGYPVAQPAGPSPGSGCSVTCPGGRSCSINCGTEGCKAWCRGKEPRCMCLAS